jgi:hypothetical protein
MRYDEVATILRVPAADNPLASVALGAISCASSWE